MWVSRKTSSTRERRHGFTIVELLIVIVVIGILAAITIVAYNGIQNRARTSTVMADLASSAKKMALDNVSNGSYALTAAAVDGGKGLPTSAGTTYQFHSTGTAYCITGTNGTSSYTISDTASTPTAGGCAGDGIGGVAAVTNLVTNPSFESGLSAWQVYGNAVGYTSSTAAAYKGASSVLMTEPSGGGWFGLQSQITVTAGSSYAASAYTNHVSGSSNVVLAIQWFTSTNTYISENATSTNPPLGSWTRQSITGIAPINAASAYIVLAYRGAVGGESFYADSVMATSTPLSGYADGSSLSWIWNGAANNSTSTGPPQ